MGNGRWAMGVLEVVMGKKDDWTGQEMADSMCELNVKSVHCDRDRDTKKKHKKRKKEKRKSRLRQKEFTLVTIKSIYVSRPCIPACIKIPLPPVPCFKVQDPLAPERLLTPRTCSLSVCYGFSSPSILIIAD